jgi:hypothetical protein
MFGRCGFEAKRIVLAMLDERSMRSGVPPLSLAR